MANAFRLALLLSPALAIGAGAASAKPAPLDLAIKATYLYKLAPYVTWPPPAFASPAAPLNICVVGHDPFGRMLDDAVAGQDVAGRPVRVHRLDTVDRASGCHVAYIGGSARQSVEDALRSLRDSAVLTVTDAERDPRGRGIIHFEVRAKRVRFHIDDRAAAEGRLEISSKLLALALTVQQRSR